MAACDALALNVVRPVRPDIQWFASAAIKPTEFPQEQDRCLDLAPGSAIGEVVLFICRGAGTIVLAHRMAHFRVVEGGAVVLERQRMKIAQAAGHLVEGEIDQYAW